MSIERPLLAREVETQTWSPGTDQQILGRALCAQVTDLDGPS